jgi:eukaryotic-like serine/threonine-protein kinase
MIGTVGEPGASTAPSLSPDGTRLAVGRNEPDNPARDIWVFDLARGTRLRVTLDAGDDLGPRWSSDGRWLVSSADRNGVRDIYKRLASGEGGDELVFESPISKSVNAWSPDGRSVAYDTGGLGRTADLHVLPLFGDRQPVALASQPGFQHQADISPDGRLIAYGSSESGKYEAIVESFPEKGGRWQISTDGGRQPFWRGDGRELFFLKDDTVMAIDVHPARHGSGQAPRPRSGQDSGAGLEWSVHERSSGCLTCRELRWGLPSQPTGNGSSRWSQSRHRSRNDSRRC